MSALCAPPLREPHSRARLLSAHALVPCYTRLRVMQNSCVETVRYDWCLGSFQVVCYRRNGCLERFWWRWWWYESKEQHMRSGAHFKSADSPVNAKPSPRAVTFTLLLQLYSLTIPSTLSASATEHIVTSGHKHTYMYDSTLKINANLETQERDNTRLVRARSAAWRTNADTRR